MFVGECLRKYERVRLLTFESECESGESVELSGQTHVLSKHKYLCLLVVYLVKISEYIYIKQP